MMKESRNILGWLGMKQEGSVLQDARKHVDVTYETVTWFKKAVSAYIAGDAAGKKSAIEKVRESEREADTLHSQMVSSLSEGLLVPPDREDIMHFVKSLERIADWTNGAARLLHFINEKLPGALSDGLAQAADIILDSVSKLKDGIHSVMDNRLDRAISDCNEVDAYESKADDHKKVLIGFLIEAKLEGVTLLLVYQLIEYMESITDKVEDAADFIKILAIKAK